MKNKAMWATLGLAVAMIFAAPSKANAGVFVGVRIGGPVVVARPVYVRVVPRPYYGYGYGYRYCRRPVVVAPAYVPPVVYYHREHWGPRPYAYRGYYGPRFRR
jgi:hypothetical protein